MVLRDLPTPLSGIVGHPWNNTCSYPPIYQILSLYLTHYEDMKVDAKYRKWDCCD